VPCNFWISQADGYEEVYFLDIAPAIWWKWTDVSKEHIASIFTIELCLMPTSGWFLTWPTLQPWRWRWHVPPKYLFISCLLYSVMSQKIELFALYLIIILRATRFIELKSINLAAARNVVIQGNPCHHLIVHLFTYCWLFLEMRQLSWKYDY
jgi:hypothetical protein